MLPKLLKIISISLLIYHIKIEPIKIEEDLCHNSKPRPTNEQGDSMPPIFIILHYTADCGEKDTIRYFKNPNTKVSAHYVVAPNGKITMMVDPLQQAFHAGKSFWKSYESLNQYAIGIEIVNPGWSEPNCPPCRKGITTWTEKDCIKISGSDKCWYKFTPEQIESVIELCQYLMKKYNIPQNNVIGHNDIAPERKLDPGPLFPWLLLAQKNIGISPCPEKSHNLQEVDSEKAQNFLQTIGYKADPAKHINKATLTAFQMHFRPNKIDGILDQETFDKLAEIHKNLSTNK